MLLEHPGVGGRRRDRRAPPPHRARRSRRTSCPSAAQSIEEDDVINFCTSLLARYKCPTKVEFVDQPARGRLAARSSAGSCGPPDRDGPIGLRHAADSAAWAGGRATASSRTAMGPGRARDGLRRRFDVDSTSRDAESAGRALAPAEARDGVDASRKPANMTARPTERAKAKPVSSDPVSTSKGRFTLMRSVPAAIATLAAANRPAAGAGAAAAPAPGRRPLRHRRHALHSAPAMTTVAPRPEPTAARIRGPTPSTSRPALRRSGSSGPQQRGGQHHPRRRTTPTSATASATRSPS